MHLTADTASTLLASLAEEGGFLDANEFTGLDEAAASVLARCQAGWMSLDGLRDLSEAAACGLASYAGPLYLNGLTQLSDAVARALAAHRGSKLSLDGLTQLSDETALALAGYPGMLSLDGLTFLSPRAYHALQQHPGGISMTALVPPAEWDFDGSEWEWVEPRERCQAHYVELIDLSLRSLECRDPRLKEDLHEFLDDMVELLSQGVSIFMEPHERDYVATVASQCQGTAALDGPEVLLHALLMLADSRPEQHLEHRGPGDPLFFLSVDHPEVALRLKAQCAALAPGVLESALMAWKDAPAESRRKKRLPQIQTWLTRLRNDAASACGSVSDAV